MRSRVTMAVMAISIFGIIVMPSGSVAEPIQESVTANVETTLWFFDVLLMPGQYRIVHDDAKKAKGEPCLSIWRKKAGGNQNPLASVYCERVMRDEVAETKVSMDRVRIGTPLYRVREIQFAGSPFGHRLP